MARGPWGCTAWMALVAAGAVPACIWDASAERDEDEDGDGAQTGPLGLSGEVSGEAPPEMLSGYWYANRGEVEVVLASFEGACDKHQAIALELADYYGEQVDWDDIDLSALEAFLTDVYQRNLPSDHWGASIWFYDEGGEWVRSYDADDGYTGIELCHQSEHIDWGAVFAGDLEGYHDTCWYADSGGAELTAYEEGGDVGATGQFTLLDADGADSGEVSFDLEVPHCDGMEEAQQALDDALNP